MLISFWVKKYSMDILVTETVPMDDNDSNRMTEREKGKGSNK